MMDMTETDELDVAKMIDGLEARGFRVLAPCGPFPPMPENMDGLRRGVVVDVETTGLDPQKDGVIQLALLVFAFDAEGYIVGAASVLSRLHDPFLPIPVEITKLTGISLDMVCGKSIDAAEVAEYVGDPDVVIAHNAKFDRPFVEALLPMFQAFKWGCSLREVSWRAEGFDGTALAHLLLRMNRHHEAHRADADVVGTLSLLDCVLPVSGVPALAALMDAVETPTLRVWAISATIERKDVLKDRGYKWNPGLDGRPKAWFRDIHPDDLAKEHYFLKEHVYMAVCMHRVVELTAFDRFSNRA